MDKGLEELTRQAYHSLAIYSVIGGLPNYLKIPDIVDSAMSRNRKQLVKDLENLMMKCIIDLCDLLLDKVVDKKFKELVEQEILKQKKKSASVKAKNSAIKILNTLLEHLNLANDIKPLPELND